MLGQKSAVVSQPPTKNLIESSDYICDLQLRQAQCQTPDRIQEVLDEGHSTVKEIKNLQEQQQGLTSKVDSHLRKLRPLAEHLSALVRQIAEVERFRAYVSWIQRIQSVRYSLNYQLLTLFVITWLCFLLLGPHAKTKYARVLWCFMKHLLATFE